MSSIQVCLHGAAHVRLGDAGRVPLERKQAALVAWLAVHGATSRSRLAGLLWPDAGEQRARGNLRQRLSKLRQSAGRLIDDDDGLLVLSSGVAVEPAPPGAQWLDGASFDDCADFSAWLDGERETQRAALRQELLAAVRDSAARGELDRALAQADHLLAVDRESEEAYRALMEVLYLRGDRAAAIAVWDRCRDMLRSLYGVLPTAATQRLGQTILDATASVAAAPTLAIPVTVLRPPLLVGREGTVETMVASWRVGHAVCVSGEAGVGKSRLLAEFAAALGSCAIASARPGDALLSYASLSRLVLAALDRFEPDRDEVTTASARLLPQIATRLDVIAPRPLRTAHEREQALRSLAQLLDGMVALGCAAFVFDDLQFADAASIEALQWLVDRDAPAGAVCPVRFAFGSRSEEEPAAATALIASLASTRRLLPIVLEPLDDDGVRTLMRSLELPGFDADRQAARLRRRVGGNPAFLLESVKLIAALGQLGAADAALPVPPGIEAVVARRLALLSPEARRLAELASIAGESFDAQLAANALGRSLTDLGDPLRELEARQVLYGRQFVHDVVAAAVRKTVPLTLAELLHRLVADWLERSGGEPAVAAAHWQSCGEWRRAGDRYRAAAEAAGRSARSAEEAAYFDAAADCYERSGAQPERFAVVRARELVTAAPDYTRSRVAQLDRLEAIAIGEEQQLQALAARVSWHADHAHTESLAEGERGLHRARALGLDALAFEFAHPVAWQLAQRGEAPRALELLTAHEAWAMTQPSIRRRARFHTARSGIHAFSDQLAEAIRDGERAIEILHAGDDPVEMLAILANVGLLLWWRGEFAAAARVLVQGRTLRDRLHGRGSALIIDLHYGGVLRDLGRYREALEVLEPTLADYKAQLVGAAELQTDVVIAENHVAQVWLLLGDALRAEAMLQTDDGSTETRFRSRRAALLLRASRQRGAVDARRLAAAVRLAGEMPVSFNRTLIEIEIARSEEASVAATRVAALLESAVLSERPGLRMHALSLQIELLLKLGKGEAALRSAMPLVELDTAGLQPFDADPLHVRAQMFAALRAAKPALAEDVRERAREWLLQTASSGVPREARAAYARRCAAACTTLDIVMPFA